MIRMYSVLALGLALLFPQDLSAQDGRGSRGDRGDRGDRGGDRGTRGGFGGGFSPGGFSMPGGVSGPPGFSGRGGFPGALGGPPGGFSFGSGGPPGGFSGGPPWMGSGGDGGDRSSRFGSMMDSNGNGKIDQEELDRMPSFVRDMMSARGIQLKAGMSLDDMRNTLRSGFSGGSPGQPGQSGQPGQPGDPNASRPKTLTPYRMKPKKPVTLTLPPAYSEVDTDFDGQLGMHEWMMTRRADLELFDQMDLDFDGFLTPEELQAAESAAASEQVVASTGGRQRLTIVSATPSRKPRDSGQQTPGVNGQDQGRDRGDRGGSSSSRGSWGGGSFGNEVAMAPQYFSRLDTDGNGTIDTNEWQQSRRVRGMFEQAGIQIGNMNLQQFTANLQKATAGQQGGGR